MKLLFLNSLLPLLFVFPSFGQSKYDTKITIALNDTTNIYRQIKVALINTEFIVKENYNMDTLSTYLRELNVIPGYMSVKAIIIGNTVTISGVYGLKKIDDWGYSAIPKNYSEVLYYKGSKTWRILSEIADKIPGQKKYSR